LITNKCHWSKSHYVKFLIDVANKVDVESNDTNDIISFELATTDAVYELLAGCLNVDESNKLPVPTLGCDTNRFEVCPFDILLASNLVTEPLANVNRKKFPLLKSILAVLDDIVILTILPETDPVVITEPENV
jgi:hypothetical protein